jgi:hypothetical protein
VFLEVGILSGGIEAMVMREREGVVYSTERDGLR